LDSDNQLGQPDVSESRSGNSRGQPQQHRIPASRSWCDRIVALGLGTGAGLSQLPHCGQLAALSAWWQSTCGTAMTLLPNSYPLSPARSRPMWQRGTLRTGRFCAIRPSQKVLTVAAAALEVGQRLRVTDLEFWISGGPARRWRADHSCCHPADVSECAAPRSSRAQMAIVAPVPGHGGIDGPVAAAVLCRRFQHGDRRRNRAIGRLLPTTPPILPTRQSGCSTILRQCKRASPPSNYTTPLH
jgi:hypothetical protein